MNSIRTFFRYGVTLRACSPIWRIATVVLLVLAMGIRAETEQDELKVNLSKALNDLNISSKVLGVERAEIDGLFEVIIDNGSVFYTTDDGKYFLVGDLYEVHDIGLVNLTEEKRSADRKAKFDAVNVEQMIVFSPKGEVKDYINVFTDVTCFFCQKLHKEVSALNDMGVEVRYLAFPRGGLESEGARKLATAWCAEDKKGVLAKLKMGVALPVNACDEAPIESQYLLGVSLGVRGTPAIVTSSGMMIPGYKSAKELLKILGLN